MDRITCPLCIDKTGVARTVPEQRHASVLPFTFSATRCEVIPCQFCIVEKAILTVTITKSRVIALAWDSSTTRHADGLVEFS